MIRRIELILSVQIADLVCFCLKKKKDSEAAHTLGWEEELSRDRFCERH